ncbi:MAG: HAMP domain-containing sensor histidine kinase [Balneolaceae bacterium]
MIKKFTYPLHIALAVFILLCAVYGYFELRELSPSHADIDLNRLMESSLNDAEELMEQIHEQFVRSSEEVQEEVQNLLLSNQNRNYIYTQIQDYDFWGLTIYREDDRWLWDGFSLTPSPFSTIEDSGIIRTSVLKRNNVVFLLGQTTFTVNDSEYNLLTARKLEQTTNLPFTENVVFDLSDDPAFKNQYPVNFNFFNPAPENIYYRKIATTTSDSAGIVYATPDDMEIYQSIHIDQVSRIRALFHLLLFISFFVLFIIWSATKKNLHSFFLQTGLILLFWIILFQSGLIDYWISQFSLLVGITDMATAFNLTSYLLNALFLMLFFFSFYSFLRKKSTSERNEFHFRTFFLAILYGALNVFLLLFFVFSTQEVLTESNIPLLDLELAPDIHSFLFYLASCIFFTAVSGMILTVGHFLFVSEQDKTIVIGVTSLFSFITISYLTDLFLNLNFFVNWIFILCFFLFLLFLLISHTLHKYPGQLNYMSGFRKMMLGVFIASSATYVIIWNAADARMDRELLERAVSFSNEETTNTRDILRTLLNELEQRLNLLSDEDIENRQDIVQTQFQRAIQSSIRPEWRNLSFDIQLLTPSGEPISDYSTNLDSPGWTALFDINMMIRSHRGEQIRQETNRPVIWERPTSLAESYVSFYRGWIPIYGEAGSNHIVAWIFGAVYLERPDYNKPMRAVLGAATSDDWKQSFYLAEFLGSQVTRSSMLGIYSNQPEYNRLPVREAEIAQTDSIAFITNFTAQGTFREVLMKSDERRVIKASTPVPGFNQHLFSFFRLHIVLVFFGLFVFSVLAMSGLSAFSLFGQSRKFQYRLLDGLTLATLMFLTVLIFATQYAVGNQNEKNVQRELINKLNGLDESIRGELDFQSDEFPLLGLSEFTSPLNVDAIFYNMATLSETTTPQIFQQHLMPRTMPFPAYNFLYIRERRHYITTAEIGTEQLLIGFRALLNEENEPIGAIAIPTFLQSPVYREQLLQTTSYLFGVYLAIFALFIVGSVFLSNRLTKPLQLIQAGLSKISRGSLKTQVAVTSRDEIGSLAKAYNEMVSRLDETQKELLRAEREAAWKEMAQQVAHEIKNPLTPMKLNLQHLQRQLENNPENVMELKPFIEKTAANVINQIESLNKIASDFSKFSKPVDEPLEPIDLKKMLTSVAELYDHDQSVHISLSLPPQELIVQGVEEELRRAFINLVKNGTEASTTGKAIVKVTSKKEKNHVMVQISDKGSGIAEEDRDKIFVPNFSTKSSGTGLGLAITKKIIEAHHGNIRFETEPDQGTTFFVRIPVKEN